MAVTFVSEGNPWAVPIHSAPYSSQLPPLDGGQFQTDTTVVATGTSGSCWIVFAPGAQVGPGVPGALELRPGIKLLLTNNPNIPIGPTVIFGDRGANMATGCTVVGMMRGGQVVIERGGADYDHGSWAVASKPPIIGLPVPTPIPAPPFSTPSGS